MLNVVKSLVMFLITRISTTVRLKMFRTCIFQWRARINFQVLYPDALKSATSRVVHGEQESGKQKDEQAGKNARAGVFRSVRAEFDEHKAFQRFHPGKLREPIFLNTFPEIVLSAEFRKCAGFIQMRFAFASVGHFNGQVGTIATVSANKIQLLS